MNLGSRNAKRVQISNQKEEIEHVEHAGWQSLRAEARSSAIEYSLGTNGILIFGENNVRVTQ